MEMKRERESVGRDGKGRGSGGLSTSRVGNINNADGWSVCSSPSTVAQCHCLTPRGARGCQEGVVRVVREERQEDGEM